MFFSGTYNEERGVRKSPTVCSFHITLVYAQRVWLYLEIVKVERAGGGRPQAELVLLFADLEALGVPIHDEAGDAFVSLSITRK